MYPEKAQFSLTSLQTAAIDFHSLNDELKQLSDNPEDYWYAMGSRLQKISQGRLYRVGGYHSFSDYCKRGIGYSRQHIYKLMKVVQFIDEKTAQGQTLEQRTRVQRLFALGFTKLYNIHALPESLLARLLKEGITESINNSFYPERSVPIEAASIGQLKRALKKNTPINKSSAPALPLPTWTSLIKSQLHAVSQLIKQCQQNITDRQQLAENLSVMADHSNTILEAINVIDADTKIPHSKEHNRT